MRGVATILLLLGAVVENHAHKLKVKAKTLPKSVKADPSSCVFDLGGATYDLGAYASTILRLEDDRDVPADDAFYFEASFCGNVDPIPQYNYCNETVGSDGLWSKEPAQVFQFYKESAHVAPGMRRCWRLAGDWTVSTNHQVGPLFDNETDVARGMSFQMFGGDKCKLEDGTYRPRETYFHLECEPAQGKFNFENVTVVEDTLCEYHVVMRSKYFCPKECPVGGGSIFGGKICSSRGVCGFDPHRKSARCFCDEGYSGDACEFTGDKGEPPHKTFAGEIVGSLFGGIFGGLLIGGGVYYYVVILLGETPGAGMLGGGGGGGFGGASSSAAAAPAFGGTADDTYVAPQIGAGGGGDHDL